MQNFVGKKDEQKKRYTEGHEADEAQFIDLSSGLFALSFFTFLSKYACTSSSHELLSAARPSSRYRETPGSHRTE